MVKNNFDMGRCIMYLNSIAGKYWRAYAIWGCFMAFCGIICLFEPPFGIGLALAAAMGAFVAEALFGWSQSPSQEGDADAGEGALPVERYLGKLVFFFAAPWLVAWGVLELISVDDPGSFRLFTFVASALLLPLCILLKKSALSLAGVIYFLVKSLQWLQSALEISPAAWVIISAAAAALLGWLAFRSQENCQKTIN